jgi:hypothetical protein
MLRKIATLDFWCSIPGNIWRWVCRRLIAIIEFNFKDWLYNQAYPADRYSNPVPTGDRYTRLNP